MPSSQIASAPPPRLHRRVATAVLAAAAAILSLLLIGPASPALANGSLQVAPVAPVTPKGIVRLQIKNPSSRGLGGSIQLRQGRSTVAKAKLARIAPGAKRVVKLNLNNPAKRQMRKRGKLRLSVRISLRGVPGKAGTVSRSLLLKPGTAKPGPSDPGPGNPPEKPRFDGTYAESNGWTMVVEDGLVKNFNGTLSTYCTATYRQKNIAFAMAADDPPSAVQADGSFEWEATRGYGFTKVKFKGRIVGNKATGNLVLESRPLILGTGRIEFDYCFAGRDFVLEAQ